VRQLAALLVALLLAATVSSCGGDDDAATTTTTTTTTTTADTSPADGAGATACEDLKAIGNLTADSADDARAIAARTDIPAELRTAIDDLVGLLGADQTQAGRAQQTMLEIRDLCAQYEQGAAD
jgi:hypothetical protein